MMLMHIHKVISIYIITFTFNLHHLRLDLTQADTAQSKGVIAFIRAIVFHSFTLRDTLCFTVIVNLSNLETPLKTSSLIILATTSKQWKTPDHMHALSCINISLHCENALYSLIFFH